MVLTIFPTVIFSQTKTPKHSNEFLSIGVGARSLGMSNAQVSIADNVTAGFWNPAGLLDIESKYEFELMHASLFAGIANFDYAGFATPIDSVQSYWVFHNKVCGRRHSRHQVFI